MIRKKSLSGLKLSAINSEIGLVASVTPAINAPISADSPIVAARFASARHQPMAMRKMYSWNTSKALIRYSRP